MAQIKVELKRKDLTIEIDRKEFALALKTWRLRQGKSQIDVAAAWGMSRYTIMRAEAGKDITWEMAYRLFSKLSDELRKEASNE